MTPRRKLIGRVAKLVGLVVLLAVAYCFWNVFSLQLNKHLPVPEMSDEEVRGLIEALRLPDGTDISAMRVVFRTDGASSRSPTIRARVRINRSQFDEIYPGSWMESHQVTASKFREYRMTLSPEYEFDWWNIPPLRPGDERLEMSFEEGEWSGYVVGVIRKSESVVDLYLVRGSQSDYASPIVVETMRKGRSPTPGIPSQTHFYEVKRGDF